MKYCEKSIRDVASTNAEILRRIYDHMLKTRKKDDVVYRPFTIFENLNMIYNSGTDFSKIYPDANAGDYVFMAYYVDGIYEKDMHINMIKNKSCEVYFNGEKKDVHRTDIRGAETYEADVTFKEGKNLVIVKVPAEEGSFQIAIRNLMTGLHMGADGYGYNAYSYVECDGYNGMECMYYSRLYKKDETPAVSMESIDWVFPVKPEQTNVKEFDFTQLCGGNGRAAYVYTEAKGKLVLEHQSPIRIFSDKEVVCESFTAGKFEADFSEFTPLLIKSINEQGKWGFKAFHSENRLAFVTGADTPDLQWIWSGPFGRITDPIEYPYVPEYKLDFKEPMVSVCGKTAYWMFYRENTYLYQYLTTSFYGQWFYAVMVGLEGMRHTAAKLGIKEFYDYFISFVETLCMHRDYGKHQRGVLGWSKYMGGAGKFDHLDAIGSYGIIISEYYMMTGDVKAKGMLEALAHGLETEVPRFPDGVFNRVKTMWTDDMYMCLPFLARYAVITGEQKYFDEAARQIIGFWERMYMHDQDIYSHIFFPLEGVPNRIPWGRGNGWVMVAISEVLMHMPKTHMDYQRILEIFRGFAKGVLNCRDKEEKIWHQVINNHNSYIETSGTAMFITGLARGVKYGWLDDSIKADIIEAWEGLTEKCVDSDGNVLGVCMGSGCSMDEQYYIDLGTIVNDDHGVGIVLTAGVAVMNMLGE